MGRVVRPCWNTRVKFGNKKLSKKVEDGVLGQSMYFEKLSVYWIVLNKATQRKQKEFWFLCKMKVTQGERECELKLGDKELGNFGKFPKYT